MKNRDGCVGRGSRSTCFTPGARNARLKDMPPESCSMPWYFFARRPVLARTGNGVSLNDSRAPKQNAKVKNSEGFHIFGLANQTTSRYKLTSERRCWRTTVRRNTKVRRGRSKREKKKTEQMPKARRDKMSYERHNRIVHLLKSEDSFPAALQSACMPPYSRFQVSHLRVRRMPANMPAILCAGPFIMLRSKLSIQASR